MAKEIKLIFPKEERLSKEQEALEEATHKQNMYWKIIQSLIKKIQIIVNDNEYLREQITLWETGNDPITLVEGVELTKPRLTGANPGSVHYQGGESKFLNMPFHDYQKEDKPIDPHDQELLDSLPYKTLTAKQREVVAVYYNPNGSAYGNQSLTAKEIYGDNSSKSRVKINQMLKRIDEKLNKS